MNIGAEIPFRRSSFYRKTGSLVFDREREQNAHENGKEPDFRVWNQGHFRKL